MQCLVIIGSQEDRQSYIREFIAAKKIKNYNTYFYIERISISEVRELKKKLSVKIGESEYRVFVFSSGATQDAQNALLKTLEEVTDDTFFLLEAKTKEVFIPTILSRSKVLFLGGQEQDGQALKRSSDFINSFLEKDLLVGDKLSAAFLYCEIFAGKETQAEFDSFLLSARNVLIDFALKEKLEENSIEKIRLLTKILAKTLEVYPLIISNNINKRLALESIFLDSLS